MAREVVIDSDGQLVVVVKEALTLQLQIENDGDWAFVDLDRREVTKLKITLQSWLDQYGKEGSDG